MTSMAGLVRRRRTRNGVVSEAIYSPCSAYRYALTRRRGDGPRVVWIMLNPSTADETRNDPTIERCERRSWAMGFGSYRIVNLFAFRATSPRDLKQAADPVGPSNDRAIRSAVRRWAGAEADRVICGWGTHGRHRERAADVAEQLRRGGTRAYHLGLTRDGDPRHPLYISYDVQPEPWRNHGAIRVR